MKLLITGASSDITISLANMLLKKGHKVFLTCSSKASLDKNREYWDRSSYAEDVQLIEFNLDSPEKSLDSISKLNIDAVVLNAWQKVDKLQDFHQFEFAEIQKEFDINVKGNSLLLQALLPSMIEEKLGRILFISSLVTISGTSKYAPYAMAKAAMEALVRNIAVDYGKYNITANILRPGIIKTERTRRFWEREYYVKRASKGIPLLKLGEPQHIAQSCLCFLEEDTYLTGAELNVSGGLPLFNTSATIKSEGKS